MSDGMFSSKFYVRWYVQLKFLKWPNFDNFIDHGPWFFLVNVNINFGSETISHLSTPSERSMLELHTACFSLS